MTAVTGRPSSVLMGVFRNDRLPSLQFDHLHMCRVYGLRASHPTHAACELLDAQNALIDQSREDGRGLSNPHGWGMASIGGDGASCFRQVDPASESEAYRREGLKLKGTMLLAHVRRATVGSTSPENTHPFRHNGAFLIHNGHVPSFSEVRGLLLSTLSEERVEAIQGATDSEHILALLLQLRDENPEARLTDITREAINRLQEWCAMTDVSIQTEVSDQSFADLDHVADDILHNTLALNLLWTDGETLAGSRFNRSLWFRERSSPYLCPICGSPHARTRDAAQYRVSVLASERVTDEDWEPVPNGSVFTVSSDGVFHQEGLVFH